MPIFNTTRIASFNILNNPNGFNDRFDRIARETVQVDPDVILFQEVNIASADLVKQRFFDLGYVNANQGDSVDNGYDPPYNANGNLILTRLPVEESLQIAFPTVRSQTPLIPACVTKLFHQGRAWYIINVHLAWGGWSEQARMQQVILLTQWAAKTKTQDPDAIIILGGDMNAEDSQDSIRFLSGQALPSPLPTGGLPVRLEQWTDAWATCGSDPDLEVTSDPASYWGRITGASVGIHLPELVPGRRIDYLFSYGWVYGKIGSPVRFGRFGDELTGGPDEPSDHYGVWADFLGDVSQ